MMTRYRMLALTFAVAAGGASVMVAEAALGENAKAAVSRERTRLVFVSRTPEEAGFIGGLTGADQVCLESAEAEGLTGTYLAWLGDGAFGPANRFEPDGIPLVNVRGEQVAAGWRELGNGGSGAPALQLDGTPSKTEPWTNVLPDGRSGIGAVACDRWWSTESHHAGAVGIEAGERVQVSSCAASRPFLCVEQ